MHTNIKNPADWSLVQPDEILEFPTRVSRSVKLTLNTTGETSVFVSAQPDMSDAVLLAAGTGMFSCEYTANAPTYVQAKAPAKGAVVFFRGHAPSHRRPGTEEPSFVNIAPRGRPTELMRMMHIQALNEKARNAVLAEEVRKLRQAQKAAEKAQPKPAPANPPEPEPAPAPASE